MPELLYFPMSLIEAKWSWELTGQVIVGGQTGSGQTTLVRLDGGGIWKAELSDICLHDADKRRLWRALSGLLDGGVEPMIVTARITPDAPFPVVGGVAVTSYDPLLFSTDIAYDTGVGHYTDVVDIVVTEAASARATELTIAINYASDLVGGELFSIDHEDYRWRLYKIVKVTEAGEDGLYTITIRPPLRTGVAANTRLFFDRPRCVMRLASPNAMDAIFEGNWIAWPRLSLIEAFPPFS